MNEIEAVNKVRVEISVVLGKTRMPINQLLKMGRGAVIELDAREQDRVLLLANNILIAKGDIMVMDGKLAVTITERVRNYEAVRRVEQAGAQAAH